MTASTPSGVNRHESSAICSLDEFLRHSYDYLIVGGGSAGLVLAARLSEEPNVMVGVLEAGKNKMADPLVRTPAAFMKMVGNPEYDWNLKSVPQVTYAQSKTRGLYETLTYVTERKS
jgi:choline dehydrogenase-like flavoprotein